MELEKIGLEGGGEDVNSVFGGLLTQRIFRTLGIYEY